MSGFPRLRLQAKYDQTQFEADFQPKDEKKEKGSFRTTAGSEKQRHPGSVPGAAISHHPRVMINSGPWGSKAPGAAVHSDSGSDAEAGIEGN